MYHLLFLLITIFAFVFTILMFASYKEQRFIFGFLAFILWFITAAGVLSIEIPYTIVYENSLDLGNHAIVSGVQEITSGMYLRFLFIGMGFICLFYTIAMFLWDNFRTLTPNDTGDDE